MKRTDELKVLQRRDPAAAIADGPLDARASADLERTLSADMPVATGRNRPTRRWLLAVASAVVATVIGLTVTDPFGAAPVATAATPPVLDGELRPGAPARQALLALASAAERDTTVPGDGNGPHLIHTVSWSLSTRIDGRQVRSAVIPEVTELFWKADRSGRITVRTGQPYLPPSKRYERAWRDDGRPGATGTVTRDETWPAGGYTPMFSNLPLPADPDRLLAALKVGHPIDQLGTGELIVAITDLYKESQPGPKVRAGLLRLLADRLDVVSLGRMTDRNHRSVRAFAVDTSLTDLPQRMVLMFDPATGSLVASEDILTKEVGKLAVPTPSVISYCMYFPGG